MDRATLAHVRWNLINCFMRLNYHRLNVRCCVLWWTDGRAGLVNCLISVWRVDDPGVTNRSRGPTVDELYCQQLVVTVLPWRSLGRRSWCDKQPRSPSIFINLLKHPCSDRPKRWNIQVWHSGLSSGGKYPYFWSYLNFLIIECRIGGRKPPCQKSAQSIEPFS